MCRRASLEPSHHVIVFENLRFRPSTRIWWISVFKTLHPGESIWNPLFSVSENADYVWTVAVFGEKSFRFPKYRLRVDGVLDLQIKLGLRIRYYVDIIYA